MIFQLTAMIITKFISSYFFPIITTKMVYESIIKDLGIKVTNKQQLFKYATITNW